MQHLNDRLVEALAEYGQNLNNSCVVHPSLPILYFGDSKRYASSPLRVLTVGLNPSREEFPDRNRFMRFPKGAPLHGRTVTSETQVQVLREALDAYFDTRNAPYRSWFDPSFEELLNGLGASFYGRKANSALHTDICSPLATDPTWSKLDSQVKSTLESTGRPLWHRLVQTLEPDIIIASVARERLSSIEFPSITNWKEVARITHTKEGRLRAKPYVAEAKWLEVSSGKRTLLLFGEAANTPFGTVSTPDKFRIGKSALAAFTSASVA